MGRSKKTLKRLAKAHKVNKEVREAMRIEKQKYSYHMKETAQYRWGNGKQLENTESEFDTYFATPTTTTTTTTTTTSPTTLRRTTRRFSTIKSSVPKELSSSPQTPKTTLQKRLTTLFV